MSQRYCRETLRAEGGGVLQRSESVHRVAVGWCEVVDLVLES